MDYREMFDRATNDLHVHTTMSAHEIEHAHYSVKEAILERIVREMVKALLPVMRQHIRIDWVSVNRQIEAKLVDKFIEFVDSRYEKS